MILWLLVGALCALLTHWIFRHTYNGYGFDENNHKVYAKKITIPRWIFILIWTLLPICGGMSIIFAPMILNFYWEYNWHFHYDSKLTRWLLKEI